MWTIAIQWTLASHAWAQLGCQAEKEVASVSNKNLGAPKNVLMLDA